MLDGARLAAADVAIARRVVRMAVLAACTGCRLDSRHVTRVLELVAAGEGSATLPGGVDARVSYGMLFVRARVARASVATSGWIEVPAL